MYWVKYLKMLAVKQPRRCIINSMLGCYTTSQQGQGLSMMMKNPIFRQYSDVFLNSNSTKYEIISAGEKALVSYCGRVSETLDDIPYLSFCAKATSKWTTKTVQPTSLPPTSAVVKYHRMRGFHQFQVWINNTCLSPLEWGWRLQSNKLLPIMTDLKPALTNVLEFIRCNCKPDCSSSRSCQFNGLHCSACGGAMVSYARTQT